MAILSVILTVYIGHTSYRPLGDELKYLASGPELPSQRPHSRETRPLAWLRARFLLKGLLLIQGKINIHVKPLKDHNDEFT